MSEAKRNEAGTTDTDTQNAAVDLLFDSCIMFEGTFIKHTTP